MIVGSLHLATYNYLVQESKVAPQQSIIYGRSVGGSAIDLAASENLVTPHYEFYYLFFVKRLTSIGKTELTEPIFYLEQGAAWIVGIGA